MIKFLRTIFYLIAICLMLMIGIYIISATSDRTTKQPGHQVASTSQTDEQFARDLNKEIDRQVAAMDKADRKARR